jgi:hypothetical protein
MDVNNIYVQNCHFSAFTKITKKEESKAHMLFNFELKKAMEQCQLHRNTIKLVILLKSNCNWYIENNLQFFTYVKWERNHRPMRHKSKQLSKSVSGSLHFMFYGSMESLTNITRSLTFLQDLNKFVQK